MDALRTLAVSQAGNVTPAQARNLLTRGELAAARSAGLLETVHEHVLRVAGFPSTPLASGFAGVLQVREPCALSGLSLGAVLGWFPMLSPVRPEVVVEEDRRRRVYAPGVDIRRLAHWSADDAVRGPLGIPLLDVVNGVMTVARHVEDGNLHGLVQRLSFEGELDVRALWRRRRTGLPGSAALSRVLERYLLGADSAREWAIYSSLLNFGRPPEHLNVCLQDSSGRSCGPFDGYSEIGLAYEYDGAEAHEDREQQDIDRSKVARATAFGIKVLRFTGADLRDFGDAWITALDRPRIRPALRVVHLPGRHCVCGHRAW